MFTPQRQLQNPLSPTAPQVLSSSTFNRDQTQLDQDIRLIIPIPFYRKGGVERVIVSLVVELAKQVKQIVLILPQKEALYFSSLIPASETIHYETFSWSKSTAQFKALLAIQKLASLSKKLKVKALEKWCFNLSKHIEYETRINYLIRQYNATHCLYLLSNRLTPPRINIPLFMLVHDLFWRFSPLSYADSYVKQYDENLLSWLNAVDVAFTNSIKTKDDILSIYPKFSSKIEPVPLSGFPSAIAPDTLQVNKQNKTLVSPKSNSTIFLFISSLGIYKDHLTLLKAGLKLADRKHDFKVVLIGKETDRLLSRDIDISQQKSTKEYVAYLQECQQLYEEHQDCFSQYFEGLGYSTYEQVEHWYSNASCIVVPSRFEGFGLSVAEAIVRGLPAIVSDLAVFQEQVDLYRCPDRVEFFSCGDADALADRMEQFILSPKHKMTAQEIQDRFSHWTWTDVAKHYVATMAKLTH